MTQCYKPTATAHHSETAQCRNNCTHDTVL